MSRYAGAPSRARSDEIFHAMVARGALVPITPPPIEPRFHPIRMEACVHESAHAIAMLLVGTRITSVTVSETGGGLAKGEPQPHQGVPAPLSPLAIAHPI